MSRKTDNKAMGPLKVSSSNSRYFTDGTCKVVYLTGSHTWSNFQDLGEANTSPFDYTAYLDFLQENHHNFTRLWVWENAAWAPWTDRKILFDPLPYLRPGPGKALDGGLKFCLTKFNQTYFDRLRSRVIAARERRIYVSVMLFQGFSVEKKGSKKNNPWRGHPFKIENNINGINGDLDRDGEGKEVHTLDIPQITRLQEIYVRKVIDTLNDVDNVIWEISNESYGKSTDWQYHMINFIHTYENGKAKQHPVLMTAQVPGGNNAFLLNSRAEAISPNRDGGYLDHPPAADGSKVIVSDTDHLWGIGGDHGWVWKSFLRGLNPIFMDPYMDKKHQDHPSKPKWGLIRKNMGYTLAFAKRVNLVDMIPRGELASSGYCLADKGKEYLIYLPRNDGVTVDLCDGTGDYFLEWFDPV
ncbi:MAG: DUF6298 domain-containing protein, partial [Methanosarcinaceae archaeon]|nr:DUF6298 domain-containing protein [Methanosarcinaceae archaeon]